MMSNRDYLEGRYDKDMIDDIKSYLDDLRESGVTNMFGATPYIMESFNIPRSDASKFLSLWMDEFGK